MPFAARQRGSVGSPPEIFPHRPIRRRIACGCVLALAWLCFGAPVHAEALYRCVGASGETVFSGSTAGYRDCKRVAGIAAPASSRRVAPHVAPVASKRPEAMATAAAVPVAPTAPSPSPMRLFVGVQSSVTTTAQRLPDRPLPSAPPTSPSSPEARAPALAGKPGQWSYRESATAPADAAPPAGQDGGDRVLRGAVYRVVHADGSVEYTNLRPGGSARAVTMLFSYIATCMACNLHSPIDWGRVRLDLASYADAVHAASAEFGVSEAFLRAVIHAESAFNPRALSLKGAQGLMQLMPGTASNMGVLDAFDPAQNIRGGARYLALLLRSFKGDERLAAAAYNAGPAAVQRYNGVPPFAETQVYVQRVGALRKRYGDALPRPLAAAGAGNF